ncbi:hypothetical protein Clacol_004670 [Clathrus columnatus]|uniref:non-specific serine/threonine protein kinase n=1 Tax=Clathrus columnatus TaxID=1419009 RepID=A0AAV5AB45_9AGAM|nr:hypothetical protein Clacol_004670 [Clathrus columnatus]
MQSEAARIASFKTVKKYSRRSSIQGSREWPHPLDGGYLAVPATLAEAGFYHDPYALYPSELTAIQDNVTCFICKEEYAEWEAGDNPHEIHLKISPKCSWALVRCSLEFDKDEEGHFEFRTKTRVPTSKTLEKARFETFGGKTEDWWPHQSASHGCNANKMAQAGFVFTPDNVPGDDTATCMYCDTSLSGWEINDDPLVEHSRRPASRECAFILSLNLTAKPPQPKTKRKARGTAKVEGEKAEKKPQQEAKHVNKEKPKLKTTKPEEIPLPPSPKKKNRPILGGIDFNKPVRAPAPSPPNNAPKKPGDRLGEIFGSYQTIKKLGAGSFGDVYLGVDLVSNRQVAIKLESTKASVVMLKVEAKMYETLRGAAGIPVMKWFGTVRDYNVLVLPVLGRSLLSVLDACGGHFSLPTVLMMADQMVGIAVDIVIARIQSLHSYGMIHRDLKPDNFLIGRELWDKTIYLIDFGMAKAYRTPGGIHIPWKTGRGFWGNSRYASLGAHDGEEQSRRNDMEALGYIFIDCLKRLPWPAPRRVANEYDDYTPIADAKRRIPISTLCAGLPVEFALFLRHARSLTFEATPDYQGMRYMFQQLAWRMGYGPDMPYDWSMLCPTRAACSTPRRVVTSNVHNCRPPMVKALTIPFLGPRPNPAGEYFRRVYPGENVHKDESDVLKSIRQVIRPPISRQIRQTILYPSHESTLEEGFVHDVELSWNSCCVILSAGVIICRKWTLEEEDQDIQWACKGLLELPGGVAEGSNASVSSTSPEDLEASSTNTSAFSRFAESAKARQRAITPPKLVSAVFVFLRSIGKIFTENGEEYTFNMPFLVRRAWPLRPHGVLLQRAVTQVEENESAQTGEPLLPTLFSLHDPFAEFKVVGVAAHIHGALGATGLPSAITRVDPNNSPDIKNPEDFDFTSFTGPKPAHSRNMQGNPPPLPPVPERLPPLQQPPATDKVLWVSEDITVGTASESLIVTCTAPIPSLQAQSRSGETPKSPSPSRQPKPHRYTHQVHLSIWRYAYLKPREIPDPVLKKRSQNNPQDKPIHDTKEFNSSTTSTPRHPHDPATIRRRELQDRADRIPPSSPPLVTAPPTGFPPPPPSTIPFSLPRQPISIQPTLASLPGGELPSSWPHPFHPQSLRPTPGHERQASQDQLRIPAVVPEPQTIKEVSENKEDIIGIRMDSGHKKIRPSIWVEKISAIPIPPEE